MNSCNFVPFNALNNSNFANYTALNNSNYVPFNALASCNYIINSVNNLTNYPNYTALNSCNYITNNITTLTNFYNKTETDGRYLRLIGGTISGNVGIGTTNNANATLELYSTSQLTSRIILSGQEFFQNTSIVSGGIAFLCGVNRTGNRQLWIGDSLLLAQNTTNPVLRISITGGIASIDSLATIGNIVLPISFGNSANTTNINGSTINLNGNLTTTGTLSFGSRVSDFLIYLWGNDYGFGINGGVLRYNVPNGASHIFYHGTTDRLNINTNGSLIASGKLIVGNNNSYPDLQLGSTNGNNLGIATGAGGFSQSALAGDMVIRSLNRLILQSGGGGAAFVIDTANNILVNALSLTNSIYLKTDLWNYSTDGKERFWFGNNGITYYRGHGGTDYTTIHEWRNKDNGKIMELDNLGNLTLQYQLSCRVFTIANANRDLLGISFENTATGSSRIAVVYAIQGTFTGIHRVFTEDEKFNKEKPQIFKDEYEGRIVISSGKIATDTNPTDKEWVIEYDKAGITIEDSLPIIQLSRKKKDKRVYGCIGDKRRSNSRSERLVVNSVGEGAVWVCNSNGCFENGDLITTSDYLGYGELQDDDLIHSYTFGKIVMNCSFELDSPYYECKEIDDLDGNGNKLRVAFVACVYYCG